MEEKNSRKIFSTILMMVGGLFIVVSGGIFVSQTWHYLPEIAKKLCLAAVTAGFFTGAHYLEKQSRLKKTPVLLYYLGVCFAGFTVMSLLDITEIGFYEKLTIAFLTMSVPVTLHFMKAKKLADFIFQLLLADGMVLCVSRYSMEYSEDMTVLSVSLVAMLLAGFIRYCKEKLPEEKNMILAAEIICWLHIGLSFPWLLIGALMERNFLFSVFPVLMLTASLTSLYLANKSVVYRVLQSIGIFLCSLSAVSFLMRNLLSANVENQWELQLFMTFLLNLAAMVILNRREMTVINGVFAGFLSIVRIAYLMWNSFWGTENGAFYPFALCMAAALIIRKYWEEPEREWKTVLWPAALWLIMELNTLLCWGFGKYCINYGVNFWFALVCIQISVLVNKKKNFRDILRSVAVLTFLGGLGRHEIVPTVIYGVDGNTVLASFDVEYHCILIAFGIVLLGKIWYDRGKVVSRLRFIGTCIILITLVCSNLLRPALPNVLFLGVGTLILLILATVLHKKDYAIASAITLVLVAFYLTKEVWMSIAWWVYLFAAGVGLVIYAIKREKAE